MYQKIIVPIDHGNRNMKTEHKVFTSGFVEGDCRPALGEYLYYNGRYYALAEQRIPYMRDKTVDDRHPDTVRGGDGGGEADAQCAGHHPPGSAAGGAAPEALRRTVPEV